MVKFEDGCNDRYIIGQTINLNAELVKKVIQYNENESFDINGYAVKLIEKNN